MARSAECGERLLRVLQETAAAAAAANFYAGKTVTIVVGFGAGGGADTFGRLLGRHLGAHLPGKPNVIVQNMPGAGGFKALNHVYHAAPKDGTHIVLTASSHATAPRWAIRAPDGTCSSCNGSAT